MTHHLRRPVEPALPATVRLFHRMLFCVGWLFLIVGGLGTCGGIWLLIDRDTAIEFNGLRTAAIGAKLCFFVVFAACGVCGAVLVSGGPDWLDRFLRAARHEAGVRSESHAPACYPARDVPPRTP